MKSKLLLIALVMLGTTNIIFSQVYYLAPDGSDDNPGTMDQPWATLSKAHASLQPGETVYLRNGIYRAYITFTNSGTEGNPITYEAYPGENPIIDGDNIASDPLNAWNLPVLISLYADHLVFRGLEVRNAASISIYCGEATYGDVFDNIHLHNSYLTGIMLIKCTNHTVMNCVIHDIYDYGVGGIGGGGNGDGIGAHAGLNLPIFEDYGYHHIINNIVYDVSDDGIDMYSSRSNIIENNIVYHTGYGNPSSGGSDPASWGQPTGNGNGFKLGAAGVGSGANIVKNNISYLNKKSGFDINSGAGNKLYNNTSFDNPIGYRHLLGNSILKNNISYNDDAIYEDLLGVSENNTWDLNITNPQFISVDPASNNFLTLSQNSPAIDSGQDLLAEGVDTDLLGLPRPQGAGFDLGAYEYAAEVAPSITLNLKTILQGPYNDATQLMDDNLRADGSIPLTEPFTALGFNHVLGGGETTTQAVLNVVGSNAIVDWIFVELRETAAPNTIIATQAAMLQRDGDIVDVDGNNLVTFTDPNVMETIVVLRHRNHLGVRTLDSYLTNATITVDFTDPATNVYGQQSLMDINGKQAMIAGDANQDGYINAVDKNAYWQIENGNLFDYLNNKADYNLDGITNPVDRNEYWRVNFGHVGQVE